MLILEIAWSFTSLFGRGIGAACPLAALSNIRLEVPPDIALSPEPSFRNGDHAIYDALKRQSLYEFLSYKYQCARARNTS